MSNQRQPDVVTVAVTRVDGGLTILRVITTEYRPTTPDEQADGHGARRANWTIDPTSAYIDAIIAKHAWEGTPHEAVSWRLVPNEMVDDTTDRTFRNAWKDGGEKTPTVHMPKARELQRDRLRHLRAPLLESLDVAYLKADESNDAKEKARIVQRKQVLRDVTAHPDIEAAATPEELKQAGLSIVQENA